MVNTEYDNWNGGTYGHTVYLSVSVKLYSSFSSEKMSEIEKVFSDSLNEVTKGDESNYFMVQITPSFGKNDIDWSLIGGQAAKDTLKQNIETLKNIMISVSTGGNRIQNEDNRYKSLHTQVKQSCKTLNITYNNNYEGLWDWYSKWSSDPNISSYQSRRDYIRDLFAPTLDLFDNIELPSTIEPLVELTDWERLNRTLIKIKKDSTLANNEEDFQGVGLLCREVIISLAQAVYNPLMHGAKDGKGVVISETDAFRMISNYISAKLSGGSNEEIRAYAKTTNKLANLLTHKRSASKKDMLLTTSATIALINFIGIIEDKL